MSKYLAQTNSDNSLPVSPKSITITDGTVISTDDYVYLQNDLSDEPFSIGRVMEFAYVPRVKQPKPLMSASWRQNSGAFDASKGRDNDTQQSGDTPKFKREGTPASSTSSVTSAASAQLRARIATFSRSRDLPVSRAKVKDTRLVIATMYSDLYLVSAIKGKCVVRHTAEIHDLSVWKNTPDHYYYNQFFDRYSSRLFDIIPVSQIRNAPQDVLQKLFDTYEFIFAESQKISDLVNTRRACTVCAKWCSISESLKCSLCDKHYHMQCLDPPISRKPAKGYSWQCAACLRRIQEQRANASSNADESADVTGDRKRTTRTTLAEEFSNSRRLLSGAGGASASDTESRAGSKRLKLSHGDGKSGTEAAATPIPRPKNRGLWPFRYFGVNTNIEDVLNDDERIYPRAVSRIGPKYQALIPDMVSPSGPALDKYLTKKRAQMLGGSNEASDDTGPANQQSSVHETAASNSAWPSTGSTTPLAGQTNQYTHRGKEGGGGAGVGGRWHGKSADQMDTTWDKIEVERGNHDEHLFFRQPSFLDNEELDMYMDSILPYLKRHFRLVRDFTLLDCQDAALHGLAQHNYDVEEALITIPECPEEYIRRRAAGDMWTNEALSKFIEGLREYGSNLQSIHEVMPENSRRAIVLRYYLIHPTKVGRRLQEEFNNRNHAGQRRPNLGEGTSNAHLDTASDAGVSSVNTPASSPRLSGLGDKPNRRCVHCQQENSSRWYAAPADMTVHYTRGAKSSGIQRIICADCREYWNHYALMPDQDSINARKHHSQQKQKASNGARGAAAPASAPASGSASASAAASVSAADQGNGNVRSKTVSVQPKARATASWPLIPCDVCRLKTRFTDHTALMCQDCGLCLHLACSGYPARARINPKRWRCGVCSNVANPTVSINYECMLCHKSAPALLAAPERPRPLMWRTSGNNWVHAHCALVVPELQLSFIHGNIIVSGFSAVPSSAWERKCSACSSAEGAVIKCCEKSCQEGAHASCAQLDIRGGGGEQLSPLGLRITLAGRMVDGGRAGDLDILNSSVADFIAGGHKLSVVLKCARHANRISSSDVDLSAANQTGVSMMSAVVASKVASGPLARNDNLMSFAAAPIAVAKPDTGTSSVVQAAVVSPVLRSSSPPPPLSSRRSSGQGSSKEPTCMRPKMVAWSKLSIDPSCAQCSTEFSPVWWPLSPGSSSNGATQTIDRKIHKSSAKVLCHRCYTMSASSVSHGNKITSS
ncbi:putative PHD type zinc finger protein with BAH domain-containing protein [Kickxella alabastrina]|nr:putative PHD type zinc finger protein with BAH domain-containing protein [Kickxella alabastrina]